MNYQGNDFDAVLPALQRWVEEGADPDVISVCVKRFMDDVLSEEVDISLAAIKRWQHEAPDGSVALAVLTR